MEAANYMVGCGCSISGLIAEIPADASNYRDFASKVFHLPIDLVSAHLVLLNLS